MTTSLLIIHHVHHATNYSVSCFMTADGAYESPHSNEIVSTPCQTRQAQGSTALSRQLINNHAQSQRGWKPFCLLPCNSSALGCSAHVFWAGIAAALNNRPGKIRSRANPETFHVLVVVKPTAQIISHMTQTLSFAFLF